ncbi:hypothetical protein AM571_CH01863 [Rhizobium etli 8C-3]|uniref:Uncharacterized protein n=1 Tax=Rhizobium etli 8C-3 TaxID=538025 RepID=A0A1L5P3H4_RHIET|nr:hypothetical protein AM571_CH01863 [Rhizobium etli 8C-3]
MKTILSVAAATLAISAGASYAQQPTEAPPPPPPDGRSVAPESTPAPQPTPSDEGARRDELRSDRDDRQPAPRRAARFYIQDGDVKISIRCADDEPTRVCADLVLQMLDRLEGSSSSRGDRDRDRDRDGYRYR